MDAEMALQRFLCEAEWTAADGTHVRGRWPLSATDPDAAMDEVMAFYEPHYEDGRGGQFLLVPVDEAEWLALSGVHPNA
jgi:hypothetical protein